MGNEGILDHAKRDDLQDNDCCSNHASNQDQENNKSI